MQNVNDNKPCFKLRKKRNDVVCPLICVVMIFQIASPTTVDATQLQHARLLKELLRVRVLQDTRRQTPASHVLVCG